MSAPLLAAATAAVVLKGVIVTTGGGAELGRQSYEDDGKVLKSQIVFVGHSFGVTIARAAHRVTVTEGTATISRDLPAGTIALENGDWQAYALAAEQFPNAREPVPVKVLVPGQGAVVNGTIKVTARPDKTRHVEVVVPPLTVEVDIGADGAVTRASVPAQTVEARAVPLPASGDAKLAAAPAAPASATPRPPPAGVVEEPITVARGGFKLRGVLWRPAAAATGDAKATPNAKLPLAFVIAGSGPTDRDGNQRALHTDAYRMLAEALAHAGVATLRFDKRGVGASDPVKEDGVTIDDFVADAAAILAEARRDGGFGKVTLIGHSEGGFIALRVAAAAPTDALVLLEAAGRPLWQVVHEQLARGGQPNAAADEIMAALREGKPVRAYPPELRALFRPSVEPFWRSTIAVDPAALLAKLTLPVTIVQGETDVQVSVEDARRLAGARKDARLVLLPRVNHVLKEEAEAKLPQPSYFDPTRPLGPGVADAVRAGVAR